MSRTWKWLRLHKGLCLVALDIAVQLVKAFLKPPGKPQPKKEN